MHQKVKNYENVGFAVFTSNIGSPVNLDKAAISRIILPAQAVEVSLYNSVGTPFIPCFRLIYRMTIIIEDNFYVDEDQCQKMYPSIWYSCSGVECRQKTISQIFGQAQKFSPIPRHQIRSLLQIFSKNVTAQQTPEIGSMGLREKRDICNR